MDMRRIKILVIAGTIMFLTTPLFAQIPSATGTIFGLTSQSTTSAGRFGSDIENYMDPRGWGGVKFDKHFFFLGGRYQTNIEPTLGYAAKLGSYYFGLYYSGTVITSGGTPGHGTIWDIRWDKNGEGKSLVHLNNNLAILFGVPNVGGFRFDWIAGAGSASPVQSSFEKFKGEDLTFNGVNVLNAEGSINGSMAFLLRYGNVFFDKLRTDAVIGFATPRTTDVTAGQVGSELYQFNQSRDSRIYGRLALGYNLNSFSYVDVDYYLIAMPGEQWEQSIGSVKTSKTAEGNIQNYIIPGYSATINFGEKIALAVRPRITFNILSEKDVYETESGKVDNGNQTTLTIVPTAAIGIRYLATNKLSFYTGTTITLFDIAFKNGTGVSYDDGASWSDFDAGSTTGMDLGVSFAVTESLSVDFNARQLLMGTFQQSPNVTLFLTFKK